MARIRLAALDLSAREVGGVERCRVLLGHLDAGTLADMAEAVPVSARARLEVLASWAGSGRLEVRSAGIAGWTPDFSVFRGPPDTALLGAHYFGSSHPSVGPSFTATLDDPASIGLMAARFDELWGPGHDVLPAIRDVLERAHGLALEAGRRGGDADRQASAGRDRRRD
ncbi:MAG: hypothetical protein KY466_10135 [Gemmatimonadetes bacterium]|nr:hypothetical protein [Gemmatimonadota bacterium]